MAATGILTTLDGPALAACAAAWSDVVEATATLAAEGSYIKTARGVRVHPAVAAQRRSTQIFLAFSKELGLTAPARARLPRADAMQNEVDELTVFLSHQEKVK